MTTIDMFDPAQSALIVQIAATRRAASTPVALAPVGPVTRTSMVPPVVVAGFWVSVLLVIVALLFVTMDPPTTRGRGIAPQCTVVITTGNAPLVQPGGPCDVQLPTI